MIIEELQIAKGSRQAVPFGPLRPLRPLRPPLRPPKWQPVPSWAHRWAHRDSLKRHRRKSGVWGGACVPDENFGPGGTLLRRTGGPLAGDVVGRVAVASPRGTLRFQVVWTGAGCPRLCGPYPLAMSCPMAETSWSMRSPRALVCVCDSVASLSMRLPS